MHTASPVTSLTAWSRRILTPCALTLIMNACVIPVGPQFDDSEQNFPPFVVSSDPGVGEILTLEKGGAGGTMAPDAGDLTAGPRFIAVTLGDHNLRDPLFLRWLFDYPSTDPGGALLVMVAELPPTGKTDRRPA